MALILSGYATNQIRAKTIQSIKLGGLNNITVLKEGVLLTMPD